MSRLRVAAAIAGAALVGAVLVPRLAAADRDAAVPDAGYRIVRAVEEGEVRSTEEVVVRAPFHSKRVVSRDGAVVDGTLANDAGLWRWVGDGWLLVDEGSRRADGASLHGILPFLTANGLAEARGSDEVAGRQCDVVRTREPVGIVASQPPTDADHAELCIAPEGVVLRERWLVGGRLLRSTTAVRFDVAPADSASAFEAAPVAAEAEGAPAPPSLRRGVKLPDSANLVFATSYDVPADVERLPNATWATFDEAGRFLEGTVERRFRRGGELVDIEELEPDRLPTRAGIETTTAVGIGSLSTDLRTLTLTVPVNDHVTVVIRASSARLIEEFARAIRIESEDL
ncbi:MAG TPA: hypothetical protein VM938_15965 [Acidimicrobiales bacterium]|nr:hypothetical protein [Acidimicrobiales bacterium]